MSEFHIFLGSQGGEKSFRVQGGNERFTSALAEAVGREHIHVNRMVKRVETQAQGAAVSYLDTATNEAGTLRARWVVSTIPLFRLSEIQFSPPLSQSKRDAIQSQTWGSYFKAHFLVPKTAERFWTQNGSSHLPLLSDSELGVIYEGNPDQEGPTKIISLLITGDQAEGFNWMPQDQAREKLSRAFEKLWPGFSKEILEVHLYRYHPRAIAGWPVGRSRFDALSQSIRTPEGALHLAGDFTESTHSSGSFESASRVVRQIAKARGETKEQDKAGGH
jgi:monoamine oxidase